MTQIRDLKEGQKKVTITGQITQKSEVTEVKSNTTNQSYTLCNATLTDTTGSIKLCLWNEQTAMVSVGDSIQIDNGYVTSFKGETQLNIGKYGKLTVL